MCIFYLRCQDAEKWDWSQYKPQPIDGSNFYTYLNMAQVSIDSSELS